MTKSKAAPGLSARCPRSLVYAGLSLAVLLAAGNARGQSSGASRQSGQSSNQSSGASTAGNESAISAGQTQLYNAAGNGAMITQDTFRGSVIAGRNNGLVLPLSIDDAIARGMQQNLGVILESSTIKSANGQRLEQLQQLLPTVTAAATITVEQVNLAAFGLKFPGPESNHRAVPGGRLPRLPDAKPGERGRA